MENNQVKRIHYIDVFKGLLIIGVVIIHMLLAFKGKAPDHTVIKAIKLIGYNTWVLFYMPAFFVVSGMCSNFNKGFKSFLISNIISLKAPIFFFIGILGALAIRREYGFSPFDFKLWFIRMFESGAWFLHALFLSRLTYYVISRYIPLLTMQLVVCIVLYTIGYIGIFHHLYPYFWICHSLSLTIFLCIGKCLNKSIISKGWISLICFMLIVIVLNVVEYRLPYIVQEPVISHYWDSLIILLLSTLGTIGLLWICMLINKSPLLEYIGRYSLMIYLLHDIFIHYYDKRTLLTNSDSIFEVASEFLVTLISIVSLCLVITYLLDKPYMRILIGKKP